VVALTLPPPPARPPAVGADAPGRGRARQLRLPQRAAAARGGPSACSPVGLHGRSRAAPQCHRGRGWREMVADRRRPPQVPPRGKLSSNRTYAHVSWNQREAWLKVRSSADGVLSTTTQPPSSLQKK
jgi:hypothetical protein